MQYREEYYKNKHEGRGRMFLGLFSMLMILAASYVVFQFMQKEEIASEKNASSVSEDETASAQGNVLKWAETKIYTEADIHAGPLVLVNQKFPSAEYSQMEMLSVYSYKNSSYMVSDKNLSLRKPVIAALNNLLEEFHRQKGDNDLLVCSGFRTFQYQQTLLEEESEKMGKEEATSWVAKPGYSEHHTGYALDFNLLHEDGTSDSYTGTGIYSWVNEHAPEYGLVVRYETEKSEFTGIQYEPWHFRYVGLPHSLIMKEHNFCLEEYIQFLRGYYPAEGEHLFFINEGKEYEIYYVKGLEVPIGEADSYLVSGDNIDGFIVTLERENKSTEKK